MLPGPVALEKIVASIVAQKGNLERLIPQYRAAVDARSASDRASSGRLSDLSWVLAAYLDALIRLRLFVEQNFTFIETLGLLAVTRYLFEVLVWLRLLQKDKRYGLVYYRELLSTQRSFYVSLKDHLTREAVLLEELSAHEAKTLQELISKAQRIVESQSRSDAMFDSTTLAMAETDRRAARSFTIYGDQARTNGYGFQAHLVRTKALPSVVKALEDLDNAETSSEDIREAAAAVKGKWNWKQQAEAAGIVDEYNFIYGYTSKLLHATPASLTTDQKNLEADEMRVFLRYIHVRLLDIIEMAEKQLAASTRIP